MSDERLSSPRATLDAVKSTLRRWWWKTVRCHDGEICHACGCPTYWTAPDELWQKVEGSEVGIRCIACFTADCEREGLLIEWRAVVAA